MQDRRTDQDPITLADAYRLLDLPGAATMAEAKRAFRDAVKAARPDQIGGDPEAFRRIIAAWRLIQRETGAPRLPAGRPSAPASNRSAFRSDPIIVPVMTAVQGGDTRITIDGRQLKVHCPAGLRDGDEIRLRRAGPEGRDVRIPVRIETTEALWVVGDDLYMTSPIADRLLIDGGRVEIATPFGPRSAWVTPGLETPVRIRLRDLGLPERGEHLRGHLFVTLQPVEDAPSAAEDLLARFTRVWTPDRLAA